MFCPNCGSKNSDDANFCENCGLNFSKLDRSSKPQTQESMKMQYQQPVQGNDNQVRTHSPILDGLEDADVADYRDTMSASYYFLSFFFFPIGIFLWAFHRDKKPESAKNILAATLGGFFMIVLIVTL